MDIYLDIVIRRQDAHGLRRTLSELEDRMYVGSPGGKAAHAFNVLGGIESYRCNDILGYYEVADIVNSFVFFHRAFLLLPYIITQT